MGFLKKPNLPEDGTIALIDKRCTGLKKQALEKQGIELIPINTCESLYDAVASHPDMLFHDLGEGDMVYSPDVDNEVLDKLVGLGFNLIRGDSNLLPKYPFSISYNAARVGDYIFHNFKYTDRVLLKEIDKRGLKKIDVKQGYSKCSICVVDEKAIITADLGIHKAALNNGIDSLLISPQKEIELEGVDYGFIGGSTGKISSDKLCIFGNVKMLMGYESIVRFVEGRGIKVISLDNENLKDYGSLITIVEK